MAGGEKKTLMIPAELYGKLTAMADMAGAESVDELASRLIRDWISKESAPKAKTEPAGIAPEDEKLVEERLKSLGYM